MPLLRKLWYQQNPTLLIQTFQQREAFLNARSGYGYLLLKTNTQETRGHPAKPVALPAR